MKGLIIERRPGAGGAFNIKCGRAGQVPISGLGWVVRELNGRLERIGKNNALAGDISRHPAGGWRGIFRDNPLIFWPIWPRGNPVNAIKLVSRSIRVGIVINRAGDAGFLRDGAIQFRRFGHAVIISGGILTDGILQEYGHEVEFENHVRTIGRGPDLLHGRAGAAAVGLHAAGVIKPARRAKGALMQALVKKSFRVKAGRFWGRAADHNIW